MCNPGVGIRHAVEPLQRDQAEGERVSQEVIAKEINHPLVSQVLFFHSAVPFSHAPTTSG